MLFVEQISMAHCFVKLIVIVTALCLLAVSTDAASKLPIGPTKVPFYTGNLSVYSFMKYWGTFGGDIPPQDWASPEHIEQLKRISCFADCDYPAWCMSEQEPGKWDFSLYKKNADALHAAGLDYIVFCWVHFTPKWYWDSTEFTPYQCAEHGEKLMQLSPWAPNVWDIYRRYYTELHKAMGDDIDWVRIATPSDYGEIGYPAGFTSWLVPQEHAHMGYWCGGPYALADFQSEMKKRFGTLDRLNARWGTEFASWADVTLPDVVWEKAAQVARESGESTDRRRWLDFVEWYYGVWLRFVPKLTDLISEFFPEQHKIVSVGYAAELTMVGNDYSLIPKMCKQTGLALQTPGNVSYYSQKRVSSACHFYGTPYYTEPPGDVPPDAEVARLFSDISNGAQVYFEYPHNLDRARARVRRYKDHMYGARPLVDLAFFNCITDHRLECGKDSFPRHNLGVADGGRDRYDYDVVDETLVKDGALKDYRVLVYVQGNVTEDYAIKGIADWVKRGGILITCDMGDVETVEKDNRVWRSIVPESVATLAEVQTDGKLDWEKVAEHCTRIVGKGLVIQLPYKPDKHAELIEAVAHINYNASDFGSYGNAPLVNGEADGIRATLLPDRILYFNGSDNKITKKVVLRAGDWEKRDMKPERMEYEMKLEPHSMEYIMLHPQHPSPNTHHPKRG